MEWVTVISQITDSVMWFAVWTHLLRFKSDKNQNFGQMWQEQQSLKHGERYCLYSTAWAWILIFRSCNSLPESCCSTFKLHLRYLWLLLPAEFFWAPASPLLFHFAFPKWCMNLLWPQVKIKGGTRGSWSPISRKTVLSCPVHHSKYDWNRVK